MCLIWNEKSKMFGKYIHDIRQHVQIKTTEYSRLQTHSEPCKWQTGISSLAILFVSNYCCSCMIPMKISLKG